MNPYIAPVYISTTNMITPLATISYDAMISFFNTVVDILQIGIQTISFIVKEGIISCLKNLTLEIIVYIIGVYNLFMVLVIDNQQRKFIEQKNKIESLEKHMDYLKKTERMREDMDEIWIKDLRTFHQETNKKVSVIEKKIKKMEKDMKIYE